MHRGETFFLVSFVFLASTFCHGRSASESLTVKVVRKVSWSLLALEATSKATITCEKKTFISLLFLGRYGACSAQAAVGSGWNRDAAGGQAASNQASFVRVCDFAAAAAGCAVYGSACGQATDSFRHYARQDSSPHVAPKPQPRQACKVGIFAFPRLWR